jgi:dnd system-associated protein 4
MATVYLPNKYLDLSKRLVSTNLKDTDKSVFPTYMHLSIFAAMVGYHIGKNSDKEEKFEKGNEISDRIYTSNQMDGFTFLLALQHTKDGDILRENKEKECWEILEQYAAVGLEEINNWMIDNPSDINGVETILNKLKLVATEILDDDDETDLSDINF